MHASPVVLWHLRFENALAAVGPRERLFSKTRETRSTPRGHWDALSVGNLQVHLPLADGERARCEACAQKCRLALDAGGMFAVFDGPLPETWTEARDRFAPDARDISVLRSRAANWRTIDALTDRLRNRQAPPSSFRYEAPGSRGIVTLFHVSGAERLVVYAYGANEAKARVLGIVNTAPEDVARILGSLVVDDGDARAGGRCD